MPSQKEILKDVVSFWPDLIEYLRQEIPIEDMRDYSSPQRINSIDFVKGFAIMMIILAHTAGAWLDNEWMFLFGTIYAALDILGPSLFIFLSALSVVFSISKKKGKIHPKIIRNQIFSRGGSILAIGLIINLVGTLLGLRKIFPYGLWGWNILVFIGFSQVFSYYALKFNKKWRAIIGLIIVFITMPLRQYLFDYKDNDLIIWTLHFIITSPDPQLTLFPYLSICFISTIFGEYLYEAMTEGTDAAYFSLFRKFLFWGVILTIAGVIFGWRLHTAETMAESEYPHIRLLEIANKNKYYQLPGLPEFIIRGTGANMLYSIGAALLLIAVCFYFIDFKKHTDNDFTRMFIYYGKISLSLFLVHLLFIPIFLWQLNIVIFLFIALSYVGFLGFSMYIWNEYANGVGSPEWFMIQISRVGQKTGEKFKRDLRKTEILIKNFTKMIAVRTITTPEKMDEFIRKRNLRKMERKKKKAVIKDFSRKISIREKTLPEKMDRFIKKKTLRKKKTRRKK